MGVHRTARPRTSRPACAHCPVPLAAGRDRNAHGAGAGFPDPTFGTGGFTILNEPVSPNERFEDVLIQPDGKVLGAGSRNGAEGFLLARFNPDGSPDLGFGVGGIRVLPDTEKKGRPG